MKIAILTSGILPVPAVQGGAVENLIDFYLEYNQQHRLHDITVYSVWHADVSRHPAMQANCNHYHYIDTSSLWAKVSRKVYGLMHQHEYYNFYIEYFFEQVWQDIKHIDYDCILLENRPGYAVKLAQRGVSNMVLHLHNDLLNNSTPRHEEVFSNLSGIFTVSDYIKGQVACIQPSDKIQTIYNGINLDNFVCKTSPVITRQSLGFDADDFLMVFSGRINKDKGIAELIESMLMLKDHPYIKLMVLGSSFFGDADNEDDFIHSLKEKAQSIQDKIVFTGFIPYKDMPDYLQVADIAVLPSIWEEPFGLTCIETMAVGLPLITTRSGGIPEICEGVATIVDRDNIVGNLAQAILDLYQHPAKQEQMSKASMQRAKQFDKETYAKNFFEALETFCK